MNDEDADAEGGEDDEEQQAKGGEGGGENKKGACVSLHPHHPAGEIKPYIISLASRSLPAVDSENKCHQHITNCILYQNINFRPLNQLKEVALAFVLE